MALAQLIGTILIFIIASISLILNVRRWNQEKKKNNSLRISAVYSDCYEGIHESGFSIFIENNGNTDVFLEGCTFETGELNLDKVIDKKLEPGNSIDVYMRFKKEHMRYITNKVRIEIFSKIGEAWVKTIEFKNKELPYDYNRYYKTKK